MPSPGGAYEFNGHKHGGDGREVDEGPTPWEKLNRERGALIDKRIAGGLTTEEQARLSELQSIADEYLKSFREEMAKYSRIDEAETLGKGT